MISPQRFTTPEDFTEEQLMIKDTIEQFILNDFMPYSDRLEHGELLLNRDLLKKLGELGLLGSHMPEEYGGMALGTNTNTLIFELMGSTGAFSTTYGAHTGIGMLPILYYGTEEQKQKYLPSLITGEKVSCYCLTEPGSGSDALAAKTRADLSADGKYYVLNGQKMWISNAGFADIFIVFAKIDGKDFTGFIVEKDMKGLTLGAEEKKMGIKGSSTRQVFFENVQVPVENLLGQKGKGHHIAFNVLNSGRYKIGPGSVGGSKRLLDISIKYANERIQFGRQISTFGAIKSKIAEGAVGIFGSESATYRTSDLIQIYIEELLKQGKSESEAELIAAEEYAIESSLLKVGSTDLLNALASECVQIHGGMGFSEETAVARGYRDARISMIYEGTNEINRMLVINMIFKNAMKGDLDIMTPAMKLQKELKERALSYEGGSDEASIAIQNFKKVALMLIGSAGQEAMSGKLDLKEDQEILLNLSNILIELYFAESAMARIRKIRDTEETPAEVYDAILQLTLHKANDRIRSQALEAIGSFVEEGKMKDYLLSIQFLCNYGVKNILQLKRTVADYLIAKNGYVL